MFNDNNFFGQAAEAGFYDHPIEQSLRFNDDSSAYLSWTPASAGNRKTWTWSGWVKRGNLTTASTRGLFCTYTDTNNKFYFYLHTDDTIVILDKQGGTTYASMKTSAVFRDASAWYHVVLSVDTTNATAADRIKIYVNGVNQSLSITTSPSQNTDLYLNQTYQHNLGEVDASGTSAFDGYLAEVNFIDGTALDASSFGETKSGVWIPKAYSGSYGTNGFYLDFGNSGSIGADVSGNGNNFTANNLAATDVVLDSPTNNFATLNPLGGSPLLSAATFSEGNLKYTSTDSYDTVLSTIGMKTGKWYFETHLDSTGYQDVGVRATPDEADANYLGQSGNGGIGYYRNNGAVLNNGTSTSTFSATAGDIIQVALDADNGYVWFGKNNSWYGTVDTSTGRFTLATTDTNPTFFFAQGYRNSRTSNFGQDSSFAGNKTAQGNTDDNGYGDFYYAPPTGYLALCTANLTVPDAMNPALDNSPQDYFNTVLYSGNSSTQSITGVGFQPDFTWIKSRSNAFVHALYDSVRGATKNLISNSTDSEYTYSSGLNAFNTDGFSLGNLSWVNFNTDAFVSWNWKANGSGVSNTDGSITSTVSANTDAGFSIITYTGDGGTTSTIGHGLNEAPDIAIFKCRNTGSTGWIVNSPTLLGTGYNLILNTDAAKAYSASSDFVYGASTIQLDYGDWANGSGRTYVCYAFHSVEGFSKFGSYTGNGSSDGSFIYTGFSPSWVMVKKTSGTGFWLIKDIKREYTYSTSTELAANLSNAEGDIDVNYQVDFLSNGFKMRNTGGDYNASGATYIYMAFAENPFKYANAR